jgi:phospholipid transport system transporter-binding protein
VTGGAALDDLGRDRLALRGELDFSTVCDLLPQGLAAFGSNRSVVLDLGGVTRSNSAGLALLLEWLQQVHGRGVELRFSNIPDALGDIARMSNVEGLLPVTAAEG